MTHWSISPSPDSPPFYKCLWSETAQVSPALKSRIRLTEADEQTYGGCEWWDIKGRWSELEQREWKMREIVRVSLFTIQERRYREIWKRWRFLKSKSTWMNEWINERTKRKWNGHQHIIAYIRLFPTSYIGQHGNKKNFSLIFMHVQCLIFSCNAWNNCLEIIVL